jgi:hypothetical protein
MEMGCSVRDAGIFLVLEIKMFGLGREEKIGLNGSNIKE